MNTQQVMEKGSLRCVPFLFFCGYSGRDDGALCLIPINHRGFSSGFWVFAGAWGFFEGFGDFFEDAFDGGGQGFEVGVGGFGASNEKKVHLYGPGVFDEAEGFAEAAFDAVASDSGFKNLGGSDEADAGRFLAYTEAQGEKRPKNNTPSLGKEGEIAHAAQAVRLF